MKAWSIFFKNRVNAVPRSLADPAVRQLSSSSSLRRELVDLALRNTLLKHGIPTSWVAIEIKSYVNGKGELYSYVRLLLKHWEPQFLQYMVAFQKNLLKRILLLDSTSQVWLRNLSWQFILTDENTCPDMPPPITWIPAIEVPELRPAPVEPEASVLVKPLPAPERITTLDRLLRSMDDGGRQYGVADFQNTEPFDHAESRH